jgi:hypothetical protein
MAAIESTHIQNETRTVSAEQGRFEESSGVFRKKGRKNDGPGVFAKLLAGLVGKKAGPPPAADILQETGTGEAIQKRQTGKEKAFLRGNPVKDGGTEGVLARFLALKREASLKTKTAADRSGSEPDIEGLLKEGALPAPGKQASSLAAEGSETPASLVIEDSGQDSGVAARGDIHPENTRDIPETKVPFRPREEAGFPFQGEVRTAAFQAEDRETGKTAENRGEAKKSDKRRDRPTLEFRDLRTHPGTEAGESQNPRALEETRNSSELVLDLRPSPEESGKPGGRTETAGETFEQLLSRELRGDLSSEIVKQAAVVLRDGEGTIRLSLKPESLGKVKVHLEMAENKVSGHIFVETEEALRAFEREIHTLEQSFRDSGFEASLNAALDYRNGGRRWKEEEASPFFSERFAAAGYDRESGQDLTEVSGGYASGLGLSAVNMLV